MRRREKFVLTSIFLTIGLWAIQFVGLEWKYFAILGLGLVSYFLSVWALFDDLQRHEWLTVVPFPSVYAVTVALFYFLLPDSLISRISILSVFGVGVYALLLTANIFSVAKGRTIQLLYAAHAVSLFFSLFTSLLFTNAIFSLNLPFYVNGIGLGLFHLVLLIMSLWSVRLEQGVGKEIIWYSALIAIILGEVALVLSFLPMPIWHISLFIMAVMYLGLSTVQSLLRGRLFRNTMNEFTLVAVFVAVLFVVLFPGK